MEEKTDYTPQALAVCKTMMDRGNHWQSLAAAGLIILHAVIKEVR